MTRFNSNVVYRTVRSEGKEHIFFKDRHSDYRMTVAPIGTMQKAKNKRFLYGILDNIGIIAPCIIIVLSLLLYINVHSFYVYIIPAASMLLVGEIGSRMDGIGSLTEQLLQYDKRDRSYFSGTLLDLDSSDKQLAKNAFLNMPEDNFVSFANKIVATGELKAARKDLLEKLNLSDSKSEVEEYAAEKVREFDKHIDNKDREIQEMLRSLREEKNQANDQELLESVMKIEQIIAA